MHTVYTHMCTIQAVYMANCNTVRIQLPWIRLRYKYPVQWFICYINTVFVLKNMKASKYN